MIEVDATFPYSQKLHGELYGAFEIREAVVLATLNATFGMPADTTYIVQEIHVIPERPELECSPLQLRVKLRSPNMDIDWTPLL